MNLTVNNLMNNLITNKVINNLIMNILMNNLIMNKLRNNLTINWASQANEVGAKKIKQQQQRICQKFVTTKVIYGRPRVY